MGNHLVVIDAGPLVALLNTRDQYHSWAIEASKQHTTGYLTTEAALSEAFFLLAHDAPAFASLLSLLERGSVVVVSHSHQEMNDIVKLMRRYSNLPMSLADATLVRLSEIHDNVRVFTTDTHFRIYRRNGRQLIPLIAPWLHD